MRMWRRNCITGSQSHSEDLYTLEEINSFLDKTFGKSVNVSEYFPVAEKYIEFVDFAENSRW